ncbi:MAG: purD, partial [Phycisphaerales bacterium]|nr:purD [Phycisphaerales bacterium]
MKILLIGSGGREHALAWKLSQSPKVQRLFCLPGNPGVAQVADCFKIDVMDFGRIERFAKDNAIDLIIIGPEDPLAAGLTDRLQKLGFKVFGPSMEAARLEGDKWFAKELMRTQSVPTAEARSFTNADAAEQYIKMHSQPIVVKAAGLAKGKGVSVCYRESEALEAIDNAMRKKIFGDAGARVVIEEFMSGPEVSVMAFVDRRHIYLMETAQDHKTIDEGDTGPMTGG